MQLYAWEDGASARQTVSHGLEILTSEKLFLFYDSKLLLSYLGKQGFCLNLKFQFIQSKVYVLQGAASIFLFFITWII